LGHRENLPAFLKTYFPAAFPLPWSADHVKVLQRLETCILRGGLFAMAMPRGGGKTSCSIRAALWALLYGHRRFVTLVGATEGHAQSLLKGALTELQFNELLIRDFPEVCYPLQALEGETRKATGQLFDGMRTTIEMKAELLSFAYLPIECYKEAGGPDAESTAGSLLRVAGITGAVRGPQRTLNDGSILRPDLVILDDPQDRESAMSTIQSERRAEIIMGDVLGMAGPGKKIAAVMPCTVIRTGDLADTFLDREKHPDWHGIKTRMMDSLPKNESLWEQYAKIRADDLRTGGDGSKATEFYRQNRAAMDEGAAPTWHERHNPDEISAVQHAMNLKIRDSQAFFAEYQNEPLAVQSGESPMRTVDMVSQKLHGLGRGVVPLSASWVTAFADVQDRALFWMVAAWATDFSGYVVDYGTWPQQPVRHFSYQKILNTLGKKYPNAGLQGGILAGLNDLADFLLEREWLREDGAAMRIDRMLVDSGHEMKLVYQFCRASKHAAIVMPSRGEGITADRKPMIEYETKNGDRVGHYWVIPKPKNRSLRFVRYDTYYWKTDIHKSLGVALGDPGSVSLYGKDPHEHLLLAEHISKSEFPTLTSGQGRQVWRWKELPNHPDNHWFDCIVGNAVAASMLGAKKISETSGVTKRSPRQRWAEVWKRKRERKA
jgi:hypothetical protein